MYKKDKWKNYFTSLFVKLVVESLWQTGLFLPVQNFVVQILKSIAINGVK